MRVSGGWNQRAVLITAPATTFIDFASAFSPSDDYDDRATATRAAAYLWSCECVPYDGPYNCSGVQNMRAALTCNHNVAKRWEQLWCIL